MMGWTSLGVVPVIVGSAVLIFSATVGFAALCSLILSSRISRAEAKPLHRHTCSVCGRVQFWHEPFDQASPCRACQMHDRRSIELDLDDFATAEDLADFLNGADVKPLETNAA